MTNNETLARECALRLAHDSRDTVDAARVVVRAEAYLAFLRGETK